MPRYIDAEKLLKDWTTEDDFQTPDERWRPESEFATIINIQPTADVQEVRHGEWIGEAEMLFNGITQAYEEIITKYRCSHCGAVERGRFPYCHCGAKMDGGEN